MKKQRTSEELAALYKQDRLPLDVALEGHFSNFGLSPVSDDDFLTIQFAIALGNVGPMDRLLALSNDRQVTVAQVIEEFKLKPFLEAQDNQGES
jgi:hypothetical protein